MCARTGSRILRASSGSRSASSSIEPLRSANRTVTCFRSPSSADLAVRIRSARWLGVYASGEADGDTVAAPDGVTRAPHSRQKFAEEGSSVPQFEQLTTRRARTPGTLLACQLASGALFRLGIPLATTDHWCRETDAGRSTCTGQR